MSAARRVFALLFAVAQTSLGAGFAIVDGQLEAQAVAGAAASHIEAEGSSTCPRQHLADCAVCRALELVGGLARRPDAGLGAPTVSAAVPSQVRDPLPRAAARLPDSRAPPLHLTGALRPRLG